MLLIILIQRVLECINKHQISDVPFRQGGTRYLRHHYCTLKASGGHSPLAKLKTLKFQ